METINVDGIELPEGRLIGEASYLEDLKEWRALIVLKSGALATCVINVKIEPMWEDRAI